ncbi:MAG: GTP-binding protein [Clostridia bacterium]|nr:GTP-binding protein [Clostridia bacterium]
MVKVNIISGFLGAGKTTLIKKLIAGAMQGEKVILLENEYGEVGVDGGFMKDAGITVTELNSGCICCTLAGDFQKAIDELIDTYHPERLIVEPTGVGKLSDIRRAVEEAREHHPELTIAGCATVVDAGRSRIYMKNFGEFFIDQIKSAETIIFSRTQLLSAERVEKSRALVAEQNPEARIITTPWDDLDAKVMLETIENPVKLLTLADLPEEEDEHEHHHDHDHEEHEHHHHDHEEHEEHHVDEHGHCSCGHDHHDHAHHHHHGHDADEVFDNIGVETAKRFTEAGLRDALSKLSDEEEYGSILRAKGILQAEDGRWLHFDYVPGETEIRYGGADYTGRLCVIGTHIDEAALRTLFGV